jgi:hypothetical protein
MTSLDKIAGAVAIALALGASALTAPPAMAQGFGFHVSPPDSNFSFGFNIGRPDRPHRPGRCISPRAIDDAIEDQGYRRVRITDYGRRYTEAIGERRGRLYEITAESCSGRVIDADRIRRF